jgi:hypothetical protein
VSAVADAHEAPVTGPAAPARRAAAPQRWPWWSVAVFAGLILYVALALDGHWVADDEGLLGQSAERALAGELPHRDFADAYTGGLTLLHAWAFRSFGVDLIVLRYLLLFCTALWIPGLYACFARFLGPLASCALTALAVVWSVPNYPAAMPSWYNLYLATLGLLLLFRHCEGRERRWLFLAGVAAGVSIAIKIAGLFFLAASLLYLVVHGARSSIETSGGGSGLRWLYLFVVVAGLGCFAAGVLGLVWSSMTPSHAFHYVLPGLALAAVAAIAAARSDGAGRGDRLTALLADVAVLLAGSMLPLILLAIPYAATGSLGALLHGVFVAPATRLIDAAWPPRPLAVALPAAALGLLTLSLGSALNRLRWVVVGLTLGLVAAAFGGGGGDAVYWLGWLALSQSTPFIVLAGSVVLVHRRLQQPAADRSWLPAFAALSAAGMCSLVQYPFAAPIYFSYVAPLTLVAAAAVWRLWAVRRAADVGVVVAALLLFGVGWLNGRGEGAMWYGLRPRPPLVALGIDRASLRVPQPDAMLYRRLVAELRRHARGGYTYAGPDTPEVYYLAGLRNPTRAMFEFMEQGTADGPPPSRLRAYGVTAVAINRRPKFSRPLPDTVVAAFEREFPASVDIGKFTVRWKE